MRAQDVGTPRVRSVRRAVMRAPVGSCGGGCCRAVGFSASAATLRGRWVRADGACVVGSMFRLSDGRNRGSSAE